MAFVKGQSGNPRNKEFVDKLISLYIKGDPIYQIISELGITKRAFNHYLYGETAWFNALSNHDYQDVLGNTITKKISCLKYGKDEAKAVALKYIKEMKMLIQQELFYLRGEKCHL